VVLYSDVAVVILRPSTRFDDENINLLALLKIHKNTRRFYILLQAFWQAENGNQVVLITAKNAAKKPKTDSEPARPARCSRAPGLQHEVPTRRTGSGLIVFA
jgi:hypothetical protein